MNNIKQIILLTILLVAVIAGFVAFKMWNKPHEDLTEEVADSSIAAADLYRAFTENEDSANLLYLDQIVDINGLIVDKSVVEDRSILVLETGDPLGKISCEMDDRYVADLEVLSPGSTVLVRGKCTGKLMDVVISQAVLIKK